MEKQFPERTVEHKKIDKPVAVVVNVLQCLCGTAGVITTGYGIIAGNNGWITQEQKNEICRIGLGGIAIAITPTVYKKLKNGDWFDKFANSIMDTKIMGLIN